VRVFRIVSSIANRRSSSRRILTPRGRELDRERELVQDAHRLDRRTRAVDHEVGADRPCPLREQRRRLIERSRRNRILALA
jgi:hypothetical protein